MKHPPTTFAFLIASVLTTSCGGDSGASASSSQAETVTISGNVYDVGARVSTWESCSDAQVLASLEGHTVSFMDADGTVVAAAPLGPTEFYDHDDECIPYSQYEATVPKLPLYQADAPGGDDASKSYEQLESEGFVWDFGGYSDM